MSEIEESRVQQIVTLHQEIAGHLKLSLEKAIRIGELLTEQKGSLKHGEFTPWVAANLPFTDRTARRYMKLYTERDKLKTDSVSDLSGAYKLLAEPKPITIREKFKVLRHQMVDVDFIEDSSEQIEEVQRIYAVGLKVAQEAGEILLDLEGELGKKITHFASLDKSIEEMLNSWEKLGEKTFGSKKPDTEWIFDPLGVMGMLLDHPILPDEWDYLQSVKTVGVILNEFKDFSKGMLDELLRARTAVGNETFKHYCEEIGLSYKKVMKVFAKSGVVCT